MSTYISMKDGQIIYFDGLQIYGRRAPYVIIDGGRLYLTPEEKEVVKNLRRSNKALKEVIQDGSVYSKNGNA